MICETNFLLVLINPRVFEISLMIVLIRVVFCEWVLPLIPIIGTGALCTALTLPHLCFVLPLFVDAAYCVLSARPLSCSQKRSSFSVLGRRPPSSVRPP
ncbi:MAG: hypothetical protein WCX22_01125 [Methanoregula sp.]